MFCTTRLGKSFWTALEAWKQTPKASLHQIWTFRPKLAFSQQKSLNFTTFQQFSQTNFSVSDLAGLMERFSRIPTGRVLFYKTLTFKFSKNWNLSYIWCYFQCFCAQIFYHRSEHPQGIFPVSLSRNRPANTLFGLVNRENWRCNPIDVVVLQSHGCMRCGRVGRHDFVSANVNLHCTSSLSNTLQICWNEATEPFKTESGEAGS